ncbi:MAG: biosynthetic arginine decarboxylase [Nitratireductor sp.]
MSDTENSDIYGIDRWGNGLMQVMPNGDVGLLDPLNKNSPAVSLPKVIHDLKDQGIATPVLLRVNSILEHSLRDLNESFANAIKSCGYKGAYRGVFPVKVNQQAEVINRIVKVGKEFHYGLEVGSKPELLIALSQPLAKESLLICNGVKDDEFVRLAILSRRIGFNTVIVLESPKELEIILRVAKNLDQKPLLGVRIKLTNQVAGKWELSSGDRSSFGMRTDKVLDVVDRLREEDMLDCLVLQHSHLGSQVANINDVRGTVSEASRFYSELVSLGVPLKYLDLGGGMGVDYTGEKQANENSINYTMEEYCTNVVEILKYALDGAGIEHPTIVTESGRGVVALSSMLVFDILDTELYSDAEDVSAQKDDHHLIGDLIAIQEYISPERLQECLSDALYYRDELRSFFMHGNVNIRAVAKGERIFRHLISKIKKVSYTCEISEQLGEQLNRFVDMYHGNFSLFQSLPDVWAIDQIHPIVPLQRLNEVPTRRAVLSDITCDSDGKIDRFVLADGISSNLPVHELSEGEAYYVGVFFVGAYQETLGDLHNLFGDTNVVTIDLTTKGGFKLLHEVEGDTISQVLEYVEYDANRCLNNFKKMVDNAVSDEQLSVKERKVLIAAYKDSLKGYTYFEDA